MGVPVLQVVKALTAKHLINKTAIIISAKHGNSPANGPLGITVSCGQLEARAFVLDWPPAMCSAGEVVGAAAPWVLG
jgi:hypothetical protein